VHALVLLAAGFSLCYEESINLTWTPTIKKNSWLKGLKKIAAVGVEPAAKYTIPY
jgi:hypothetical protein